MLHLEVNETAYPSKLNVMAISIDIDDGKTWCEVMS